MKKIIVSLLMVIMSLSTALDVAAANGKVANAYAEILQRHPMDVKYIYYDIDKDGTDELMVEKEGCEAERRMFIYTCTNEGGVRLLGEIQSSHSTFATIPDKNGLMLIRAHSGRQYAGIISIDGDKIIGEQELFYKEFTPEDDEYCEPDEIYLSSIKLSFLYKDNTTTEGVNNSYVSKIEISDAALETTLNIADLYLKDTYSCDKTETILQEFCDLYWYEMSAEQQQAIVSRLNQAKKKKLNNMFSSGRNYFNSGLYYEAIATVQGFCDLYWYEMSWEEQQDALWIINNSKFRLAEMFYNEGIKCYSAGVLQEAQGDSGEASYVKARKNLKEALGLYEQLNYDNKAKEVNNYIYDLDVKLREIEKAYLEKIINALDEKGAQLDRAMKHLDRVLDGLTSDEIYKDTLW